LGDESLVWQAIEDLEHCALSDAEKSLLRFVGKVNQDCATVNVADIAALHEAGYNDEAIYDAITVCALFNFYNRWIDGSGVSDLPREAYRQSGRNLAREGYAREETPASAGKPD
jgi:alkylhydroperoxidase family enzyme